MTLWPWLLVPVVCAVFGWKLGRWYERRRRTAMHEAQHLQGGAYRTAAAREPEPRAPRPHCASPRDIGDSGIGGRCSGLADPRCAGGNCSKHCNEYCPAGCGS